MNMLAEFEWYRHPNGYEIKRDRVLEEPWTGFSERGRKRSSMYDELRWIVPKGDPANYLWYRPFVRCGDIADAFVRVSTPNELLRFINDYGPLTRACLPQVSVQQRQGGDTVGSCAGESVPDGLVHAEIFRETLKLKTAGDLKKLATHFQAKIAPLIGDGLVGKAELIADSESGLRIRLTPPVLLSALWYQASRADTQLHRAKYHISFKCPGCNEIFEGGRRARERYRLHILSSAQCRISLEQAPQTVTKAPLKSAASQSRVKMRGRIARGN